MKKKFSPTRTYYQCGICDCYHAVEWDGDCREDAARLAADEIEDRHGPFSWTEVPMPTWEDFN